MVPQSILYSLSAVHSNWSPIWHTFHRASDVPEIMAI